jgi:hypothetical protein
MPKPTKSLRAADPVTPDARGQWLVLIGDSGETSANDIEAFFADIWPDVEPEATVQGDRRIHPQTRWADQRGDAVDSKDESRTAGPMTVPVNSVPHSRVTNWLAWPEPQASLARTAQGLT